MRRAFTLALILIIGVFARLPAVPAQPVSKTARVGFFYFGARQPGPGAEAGQKFGVQVVLAEASTTAQIESGFATLARERSHVVMLFGDTFFAQQLPEIARAALKHRLPSTYIVRQYVDAGGLMSYGAPIIENFRRAATYVDKIFKGATPAQLPFEQPTNYELAINLKTARALGLTIPQSIRLRANDLVE